MDPQGSRLKRQAEVSTPPTTTTTTTTTTNLDQNHHTTKLKTLPKDIENVNIKVNRKKVKTWNEMKLEKGGFILTKVTDYGIVKSSRKTKNKSVKIFREGLKADAR